MDVKCVKRSFLMKEVSIKKWVQELRHDVQTPVESVLNLIKVLDQPSQGEWAEAREALLGTLDAALKKSEELLNRLESQEKRD
jgi:light-regulated signal transduction histidine kinase (bacteriophytochrome)